MKKGFSLIELMIVVAIIAILAMIAIPMYQRYIERSRNSAAQSQLQNIALAEMAIQTEGATTGVANYAYTDASGPGAPTALVEIERMANFGFRPDNSVVFQILPPAAMGGGTVAPAGFVAYAAHNSAGSMLYVYDNISGSGVMLCNSTVTYAGQTTPTTGYSRYNYDGTQTAGSRVTALSTTNFALGVDDDDMYYVVTAGN